MKNKKITTIILYLLFEILILIICLFSGYLLDNIFRGNLNFIKEISMINILSSFFNNQKHLSLTILIFLFINLFIIKILILDKKKYKDKLMKITDDIFIPKPTGESQYGSVFFGNDNDRLISFNKYILDKNSELNDIINKPSTVFNKNFIKSGGVVVNMTDKGIHQEIMYIDDDVHTLIIGATRSGKTRNVILPSIATIALGNENMVITDPKGELYYYTNQFLESLNYSVYTLDFRNPSKSNKYNFLQPIIDDVNDENIDGAIDKTFDLVEILVSDDNHNEKIWVNGEKAVIGALILSTVYDNRFDYEKQNLTNVYYSLTKYANSGGFDKFISSLDKTHPALIFLQIIKFAPDKTRGSFITSALVSLRLFATNTIYNITSKTDLNFSNINDEKFAIFIILPDEKTTYYKIASIIVEQLYAISVKVADKNGGRLKRRINYLLDEFGNFTKIPNFSTKLSVGGSRGIRFNLCIQDFSQLEEIYGTNVLKTIKANVENWIFLQSDELETLKIISDKLGTYTINSYSLSSENKATSDIKDYSITKISRNLLMPNELKLLKRPFVLVTCRGFVFINKLEDLSIWYFNDLYGLGDKEHNIKIIKEREGMRKENKLKSFKMNDNYEARRNKWEI